MTEEAMAMALAVARPRAKGKTALAVLLEMVVRRAVVTEQADVLQRLGMRCGEQSCARL